jgi:hypothetical protein
MRIVTFISSNFGQSLGFLFLYDPFIYTVFSFSLPFTNFRQDILNVGLITAKPTSYFLIQFPLPSDMNLSFRVAPRISPAVMSHSLHLRYTKTYRNAVSNDKSHSVLGLGSLAQGVWKLPANIHFWFTFA